MRFVLSCKSDVFFSGQNVITQGMLEDTFFVIRRGKADVLVDDVVVGSIGAGVPLGELALMYGARRSATVRCRGPCEVFYLDRAAYDSGISILPQAAKQGPLVKIMQRYWDLVSGPGGSKRPEVDYAVYLQYHTRITKTLTNAADMDDYSDDEARGIAQEDWGEDTKRYGVKLSGCLTLPMFFDSIYQMVDLWAADLDVSFTEFLELMFNNIAEWVEEDLHWKFKPMKDVKGQGEKLDDIQNRAMLEQEEVERLRREAEEAAETYRLEQERLAHERRQKIRDQQALMDKRNARDEFFAGCKSRLQALDDEEAEILRRLAAGGLSPEEEEALRRRLAEIAQERIEIRMEMLNYERNEMLERLKNGGLSPEEEEELRRGLAVLEQMEFQLRIDRLDAEEKELLRRLATGLLSREEEEEIRRRLYALQQERVGLQKDKLDAEQREMQRRLASGLLSPEDEEAARRRLGAIQLEKVNLKLMGLDLEEAEMHRRLESGLLSPEEEFEYEMRLKQLAKDRLMLQLEALQVEEDEWLRRLATGLLSPEEEDEARERLKWIAEERKRLLNKPPPTFFTVKREVVIRDVTTSQVRFSRQERVKRMQTRREIQMEKLKRKEEAEKAAAQQRSPAAQRQAERRSQRAARVAARCAARVAAAARAVEEEEEMMQWQQMSMGDSGGGGHASYMARARREARAEMTETQEWRSSVAGVGSSYISPRPEEVEVDATVLRPGRTSPVKRQIGFGRPENTSIVKPIVAAKKPGQGVEPEQEAVPKLTRTQKKRLREQKRQQRRWLDQQQEHEQSLRRSRSLPNWPERDSSWRQSTFDVGSPARGPASPGERTAQRMWYAEDETRRFVKGTVTKGYLPPVGSPGGLSAVAGTRVA